MFFHWRSVRPRRAISGARAGREGGHDVLRDGLAVGWLVGGVGGSDSLVALPGDQDLVVGVAAFQAVGQSGPLPLGQVPGGAVQDVADPVEGVAGVSAVPQGVLLDAAADLVHRLGGELDDVERIEHWDRLGQLVGQSVGVAAERVQGRNLDPAAEAG